MYINGNFSFRLSPRLNIDRRTTKIGTNDHYHELDKGIKIPHCQSKMAAKNQDGRNKIEFFDISTSDRGDFSRIIELALFILFLYWSFTAFF